jgi:hypothetical protein
VALVIWRYGELTAPTGEAAALADRVVSIASLKEVSAVFSGLQDRGLSRWLVPYIGGALRRRAPRRGEPVHVLLCIADHYEPQHGKVSAEQASARVDRWVSEYPRLFDRFRDSDGHPPRHTFFFPIDEYDPSHVDRIAGLCRQGYGEVEIHHHHDGDTAESLRQRLLAFRDLFH